MDLFNNIIETFSGKNDTKNTDKFKINNYIPHIFLITILVICVILGLIYIDEISELLGLSKSNKVIEYIESTGYTNNHLI